MSIAGHHWIKNNLVKDRTDEIVYYVEWIHDGCWLAYEKYFTTLRAAKRYAEIQYPRVAKWLKSYDSFTH